MLAEFWTAGHFQLPAKLTSMLSTQVRTCELPEYSRGRPSAAVVGWVEMDCGILVAIPCPHSGAYLVERVCTFETPVSLLGCLLPTVPMRFHKDTDEL